jgi:Protein of unknown function (DUF2970)
LEEGQKAVRQASLFQAIKMVLSAFIGIRRQGGNDGHDGQEIRVTPVQVVITGIIAAALFVFIIISVVRLVLR